MPKVSVIVPVYNSENTLDRCLKSIINQTLKEIEIILINDGSNDNSLTICNRYKEIDKRVKVFSIENSGAAVARNVGLKNVTGEYIGFVDSDDWVDYKMYETLYKIAIIQNVEVVSSNFVQDFPNRSIINKVDYKDGCYSEKDLLNIIYPNLICNEKLENNVPYTMVTKIFRRSLLQENKISFHEPLLGGQDMAFSIKCFLHSKKFYLSKNDYFYHYVYNKKSRTNTYLKNSWQIYVTANKYFDQLIKNYKKYDFSNQIKYDLLRGAMSSINYELKPGNKKNLKGKLESIKKINTDERLIEIYNLIDTRKLSLSRGLLFYLMKNNYVIIIYIFSIIRNILKKLKVGS